MTKKPKVEPPWDHRLIGRAGRAMKRARGTKSARWLSDETAALGHPMASTVLAKLDSGHRGGILNVTELMVLAAALNMPPAPLLFPGYPEADIEFLPGHSAPAKQVVDWFCGRGRLPLNPGAASDREVGPHNIGIELVRATEAYAKASADIRAVQGFPEDTPLKDQILLDAQQQFLEMAARINELRSELEDEN